MKLKFKFFQTFWKCYKLAEKDCSETFIDPLARKKKKKKKKKIVLQSAIGLIINTITQLNF